MGKTNSNTASIRASAIAYIFADRANNQRITRVDGASLAVNLIPGILIYVHQWNTSEHKNFVIQWGTRFMSPSEHASFSALISEQLVSPFKSDLMPSRNKSETLLPEIGICFCLKNAKDRKAGEVGRNCDILVSVPSIINRSYL